MNTDISVSLKGISCSKGIGIGKVFKVRKNSLSTKSSLKCDPETEMARLRAAIAEYKDFNSKLSDRVDSILNSREGDIIRSQSLIVDDPELNNLFTKFINTGRSAEDAVGEVCKIFGNMISLTEDPIIRERKADIEDISESLIGILSGGSSYKYDFEPDTVIVGKTVVPSLISGLEHGNVSGIISEYGNDTSHSAILAKAFGIPMVSGTPGVYDSLKDGDTVVVDGIDGEVYIRPDDDKCKFYKEKLDFYIARKKELEKYTDEKSYFPSGEPFEILCNITGVSDIRKAENAGADGVGLFRTEFLFMNQSEPPSEEKQFLIYKKAATDLKGKKLVIRTLDVGGDKEISYIRIDKEDNPFLGIRGIRFSLKEKKLLHDQLRAILRASAYGKISILVPMVTIPEEFCDFKKLLIETRDELRAEGIETADHISVGCMIETPGAVLLADKLASEADFFSIGTNDLIQYILCAERGNPDLAYLYSAYYPAVLRAVKMIADSAKKAGIPVCVCGEAASDIRLLPVFAGMGIKGISVEPDSVTEMRKGFLQLDFSKLENLCVKIMDMGKGEEVRILLESKEK